MFGMGKKVDVTEITKELNEGKALLVDVRGNSEWNAGHAKGALHLPVDQIMSGALPTKDTATKLYLYCASGGRARMAAGVLKGKGYDVENLGGLSSWRNAGGSLA